MANPTDDELRRLEEDLLVLDRLSRLEADQEQKERAVLAATERELANREQNLRNTVGQGVPHGGINASPSYTSQPPGPPVPTGPLTLPPEDESMAVRRVLMDQEERAFRAQRELEELRYRRQLFEAQQRNDYFRGLLRYVQENERRRLAEEREVDRLRSRLHQHRLDALVNEELIRRDAARRAQAPEQEETVQAAKNRIEARRSQADSPTRVNHRLE